jgi:Caspase domain
MTNSERVRPQNKPLADMALKAFERCKAAGAPAWAMLPPEPSAKMAVLLRQIDGLVAQLYSGKITFGEYNAKRLRILGEIPGALAVIGNQQSVALATQPIKPAPVAASTAPTVAARPLKQAPTTQRDAPPKVRLALVVGDSAYANLTKLTNPERDARAIADVLTKMGFRVRLVTNASEQDTRREVRRFAGETEKADIALVYYAGHGAQVNGENFILPVDMDIPRTEADIQLTGLKVDDLVNSLKAKTKVVFLDACRDNPALFKNLIKGRGAHPTGLAPAVASNFSQTDPGGGVFIAYATDAGTVALDGKGEHRPFTEALLRNIGKPLSIDDLFSLVTREVRLVTKNAQRPYKYASLENIVCLTDQCSAYSSSGDGDKLDGGAGVNSDLTQQVSRSEGTIYA